MSIRKSRLARVLGSVIAIAVAAGLVSCSSLPAPSGGQTASPRSSKLLAADSLANPTGGSNFDRSVPDFSGPWAADFAEAYRSTTDEVVRAILSKESITDQDYATVAGTFVKCMANKGFQVKIDGPAGEATVSNAPTQKDTDRAIAASNHAMRGGACSVRFGTCF